MDMVLTKCRSCHELTGKMLRIDCARVLEVPRTNSRSILNGQIKTSLLLQ
jgi:hypothetical protein